MPAVDLGGAAGEGEAGAGAGALGDDAAAGDDGEAVGAEAEGLDRVGGVEYGDVEHVGGAERVPGVERSSLTTSDCFSPPTYPPMLAAALAASNVNWNPYLISFRWSHVERLKGLGV